MTVRNIFASQANTAVSGLLYITNASTYSTVGATSTTVVIPASAITDDILIVAISCTRTGSSSSPTITVPGGYTIANSTESTGSSPLTATRTSVFHKKVGPTDPGSNLTVSHTTADVRSILVLVFRNSTGLSSAYMTSSVASFGSIGSISTPPAQVITISGVNKPCAAIAVYTYSSSRTFSGSPRLDLISGPLAVYHSIYNSSPVDVNVACTTSSSTVVMQSFYFRVG